MDGISANVATLQSTITDEIIKIIGLSPNRLGGRAVSKVLHPGLQRFSNLAATFDHLVSSSGFQEATKIAVDYLTTEIEVQGAEEIPHEGPLLIASNHPGTLDAFLIASNLPRDDMKIVVSGAPFFRSLPATGQHFIWTTHDPHDRMGAVRSILRHLKEGKTLLIFPSGTVDPDPAVMPGLEAALETWSPSLDLILRKLPETQVVVTIISGVLNSSSFRNPLCGIRKHPRDRQKMAEFIQTMRQIFKPHSVSLHARATFERPVSASSLLGEFPQENLTSLLIQRAKRTLASHTASAGSQEGLV